MGFQDFSFHCSDDDSCEYEEDMPDERAALVFSKLRAGIFLDVITQNQNERTEDPLLIGRLAAFDKSFVTLEQLSARQPFPICPLNQAVFVRSCTRRISFKLAGVVEQSSQTVCKVGNLKVIEIPDNRRSFRQVMNVPAYLYSQEDRDCQNPEECTLVDISARGACVDSTYIHKKDEILYLQVKLENRQSMFLLGQVIRVSRNKSGQYRCGILFAEIWNDELENLTSILNELRSNGLSG